MPHTLTALVFLLLNIGDAVSTYVGLGRGLSELNPLPAALLARYGLGAMLSAKAFIILGALVLVLALGRRYPLLWRGLWGISIGMALVVVSNIVQMVMG